MKWTPQASRSWIRREFLASHLSCFTCSWPPSAPSVPACGCSAQPLGKEKLFEWLKCLRCSIRLKAYKQASWVRDRWAPQPHLACPRVLLAKQRVGRVNLGLQWSHLAAPRRCSDKHQYGEDSPLTRWRGMTPTLAADLTWPCYCERGWVRSGRMHERWLFSIAGECARPIYQQKW